jgi:hypothetical protein
MLLLALATTCPSKIRWPIHRSLTKTRSFSIAKKPVQYGFLRNISSRFGSFAASRYTRQSCSSARRGLRPTVRSDATTRRPASLRDSSRSGRRVFGPTFTDMWSAREVVPESWRPPIAALPRPADELLGSTSGCRTSSGPIPTSRAGYPSSFTTSSCASCGSRILRGL